MSSLCSLQNQLGGFFSSLSAFVVEMCIENCEETFVIDLLEAMEKFPKKDRLTFFVHSKDASPTYVAWVAVRGCLLSQL